MNRFTIITIWLCIAGMVGYGSYFMISYEQPELFNDTISNHQYNERALSKEAEQIDNSYELNEQEEQEVVAMVKEDNILAQQDTETKSIEVLRNEVHELLDEIIEIDDTVAIDFEMNTNVKLNE
jgi:hypothetical protein